MTASLQNHTASVEPKSTEELKAIMKTVLELTALEGASAASVNINHDSGFAVDVRMKEVETVAFSEDKHVSVTAYMGKQKGSASSTDTSHKALEAMVKAAVDIAKVSAKDPCFGLADKSLMLVDNHYPDLELYYPWDISPHAAIEAALECEAMALALDKRICNSDGVNLATYTFCHGYANTHGCEAVVLSTRHSLSCSLIAKEKELMQRDYDYTTARSPKDLIALKALAENTVHRATSRLGAKKIATQKAPVLFSSRLSTGLFSCFIQAINGVNLYRKNSFLLDSIDTEIFPEFIRIYEQPHLLGALGSAPCDGEGVLTRNNVFVDKGILQQYVLNSYTARKLGLSTTANCGGVFNLTIEPTAEDLNALVKTMHRGLLVTELMGHGINILTGDYSRGAVGFWVEDGKIQFPVEEVTIAGNLKTMFKRIVGVGKDINPSSTTRCGSVLVEEMTIAGH